MIKNLKIRHIIEDNDKWVDVSIYKEGIGHYLVKHRNVSIGDLVYFNGESVSYISYLVDEIFNLFYSCLTDKLTDEVEEHFHPNEPISDHVQKVSTEPLSHIISLPKQKEIQINTADLVSILTSILAPVKSLELEAKAK